MVSVSLLLDATTSPRHNYSGPVGRIPTNTSARASSPERLPSYNLPHYPFVSGVEGEFVEGLGEFIYSRYKWEEIG